MAGAFYPLLFGRNVLPPENRSAYIPALTYWGSQYAIMKAFGKGLQINYSYKFSLCLKLALKLFL